MTLLRSLGLVAVGAGLATAGLFVWQTRTAVDADEPAAVEAVMPADPLALDAGQQARLGITTGRLAAAQDTAGMAAFARVLDAGPLAAIDSEIRTAQAAATASAADAARLAELGRQDQSASARSVQVAAAQAMADRQRVVLAERRIALEFGPGLAALNTVDRAGLIADISARRAALLRIDIPGSVGTAGRVTVGDPARQVALLGAAASADPRIQGAALLAILRGPGAQAAAAGRLLPAHITAGPQIPGTIVPIAAVIRSRGQLWVYVPSAGSFARRAIGDARPVAGGWFVTTGVHPGDTLVTGGAGALLGIENGPAPAEDD